MCRTSQAYNSDTWSISTRRLTEERFQVERNIEAWMLQNVSEKKEENETNDIVMFDKA